MVRKLFACCLYSLVLGLILIQGTANSAHVVRDDVIVGVVGTIEQGTAARVIQEVQRQPTKAIYLESEGGSVAEALLIGQLVLVEGLDTIVITRCESACSMIFIAGRQQIMYEATDQSPKVGMHHPFYLEEGKVVPIKDEITPVMLQTYMEIVGFSKKQVDLFLEKTYSTDPETMFYINKDNYQDFGFEYLKEEN